MNIETEAFLTGTLESLTGQKLEISTTVHSVFTFTPKSVSHGVAYGYNSDEAMATYVVLAHIVSIRIV